jgi:DNA-directed RNA polymerase subunit beta'
MGAEAIKEILAKIDLDKLSEELIEEATNNGAKGRSGQCVGLEVVEAFRTSGKQA